jgi:hypothetical protein
MTRVSRGNREEGRKALLVQRRRKRRDRGFGFAMAIICGLI